jgi:hypothetical protein
MSLSLNLVTLCPFSAPAICHLEDAPEDQSALILSWGKQLDGIAMQLVVPEPAIRVA